MDEQQRTNLERRLDNWGAWARARNGASGACASAERRYVTPRDDDGERLSRGSREPISVSDAEVIEAAILRLRRAADRRFLVGTYVHQWANVTIASEFNIRPMLVQPHLMRIIGALLYHLEHDHQLVLHAPLHADRRMAGSRIPWLMQPATARRDAP